MSNRIEVKIIDSDDLEIVKRRTELWAKASVAHTQIELDLETARQLAEKGVKTAKGKLERELSFHETLILALTREHPDWFADAKTLSTGFADIACRATTSHKAPDEQHSIRLIKKAAEACEDEVQRARLLGLIRTTETLNLEAIECLGDKELERFRVVRVRAKSYTLSLPKPRAAKKKKAAVKDEEAPGVAVAA